MADTSKIVQSDAAVKQGVLSEDARTRILTHGIHEESIFYQRLNFFFLIEALLLGAIVQTNTSDHPLAHLMETVSAVGLLTSTVWLLVQLDKLRLLTTIGDVLKDCAPEFAETLKRAKRGPGIDIPATVLLAWGIPLIFVAAWTIILALTVRV